MTDTKKREHKNKEEGSLIKASQDYISRILSTPGMKVLLLDADTTTTTGMVFSLSESISKEVFLIERIDREQDAKGDSQAMHHLKAFVFVRPCGSSIDAIVKHLKQPKFSEYHLFFTNVVSVEQLSTIAEADEFELVRQVQEYYADFYAHDPFVFSANLYFNKPLYQPPAYWLSKEKEVFARNVTTIISSFLALKTAPIIRYSKSSDLVKGIANSIHRHMEEDPALFFFEKEKKEPPLLLIVDRRDDPVTPLLTQWTYQAMVHELLEIKNNRVSLKEVKNIRADLKDVVLSSTQDKFFKNSMFLNYGDLGSAVKALVESYQQKSKSTTKLDTIEEMQKFVESFPEFRELGNNVSKHVAIMTELSRIVNERRLMQVSGLEQTLACDQDHTPALEGLLDLLENPKIYFYEKLRLVMLYALRYEHQKETISQAKKLLKDRATSDLDRKLVEAVDQILLHSGQGVRGGDLYGDRVFLDRIVGVFGLKGVENMYTRHRPRLISHLEQLLKGKLDTTSFPFVEGGTKGGKYKRVFIYVVGGVTYAEAAAVHALNQTETGTRLILGGSCIHNSRSFINDLIGLDSTTTL